jgi:hypothetical protein
MINNFYNKIHYNKYLLFRKYAEKINDFLDKGYMIFDENNDLIKYKFEFEDNGNIDLPISDNSKVGYIGDITKGLKKESPMSSALG